MEPTTFIDDAEFWLPPEFLTDEDFLVEKENGCAGIDDSKCLFTDETRQGFGSFGFNSGLFSPVKPIDDDESFVAGLTRQLDHSTLEDDFYGGFFGNHASPAGEDNKAWGRTRSPQSTLCAAGIGCGCRNQRSNQSCQSRASSQAAWDLYCAAVEGVATMDDYNNHGGRGLLGHPRKHSSASAAVKNPNNGSGYYNHHSLPYQKLQALQFQQLKQQQLMKHHRQLVQQSRGLGRLSSNKIGGPVDLSSSAWCNQQPRRDGSGMRAVFLGDQTGKRGSTGTGVFLPRRVNHNASPATAETRKKPALATVLVPTRVAHVLNLNLDEPIRSSASLNDASRRQRINYGGVRAEQTVNDPRLPSDWAY